MVGGGPVRTIYILRYGKCEIELPNTQRAHQQLRMGQPAVGHGLHHVLLGFVLAWNVGKPHRAAKLASAARRIGCAEWKLGPNAQPLEVRAHVVDKRGFQFVGLANFTDDFQNLQNRV